MQFDPVQNKALEVERSARPHACQVGRNVAPVVLKQQAVPIPQGVIFQIQAGIVRKMRCPQQRAGLGGGGAAVGPTVQGAHDVAGGRSRLSGVQRTAPLQHQGLAMATHIGDELNARRRAHQSAAVAFLRQRGVVTH